jgi:hypothetical protein
MAGNRLGARGSYVYNSDGGSTYIVETDTSLAIAGFGAAGAAPVAYDPASPGSAVPAPKRFKPRGVYVQASDGARKFMVCFSATASAYARNNSASYTIDTEEGWVSTGRRGEQQSF